jgi:prepilin peptidase dependent protein B
MQLNTTRRQRGFSLVELMVAMVIGLIVIGASLSVFIGILGANSTQMKISRLNHELRTVMTAVTRDLRRAGYNNWTVAQLAAGDFTVSGQLDPAMTAGSIEVSYDIDSNGGTERYGFRLEGNALQAYVATGTPLGTPVWTNVTDPNVIQITGFSITDRSPAPINPTGAAAPVTVPVYSIVITGRLTSDNTTVRTLQETVRLRNVILG